MQLYKLADAYAQISELEDNYEFSTALLQLQDDAEKKLLAISCILVNLDAEQKAYKAKADELSAHVHALENRMNWVKKYAQDSMDKLELKKVEDGVHQIRLQKNGTPSVDLDYFDPDEKDNEIPDKYQYVITEIELPQWKKLQPEIKALFSSTEIKTRVKQIADDLKRNIKVPGARLVQGEHIRYK